ncbi:thioredoxin domain-containing protein [Sulfobacillus acidophilus]|uniref:Thioredoxin domain-containing protein n=1 Tax=Sulfobacillus acidophilus TaxID=53633 RepID=A0ABS3AWF4_9FIRM|nr:thioredoxin domain-containing protein [Sulfobacillus acidophilus]
MKNGLTLGLMVVVVAAMGWFSWYSWDRMNKMEAKMAQLQKGAAPAAQRGPPPQTTAYKLPMGRSPFMGNKDAKVSVVVFSDFQCPFCARVDPMLQDALKDNDLKNDVNVVFKNFPLSFHKDAKPAAKAALAAWEQDKFWEMSEKLYANQRALTPENFTKWAKEIGLNMTKWENDMKNNDSKYDTWIKEDMTMGLNNAKVRGTPSIYVGGWELRERSVDGIKKVIKEKNLL